ncbi:hypothetical protein [Hymenobacter koreensis]|uniref:Hemin receptor n=1 Tax=Hymenobacter koreensis TaxID=1084523 RepID=A0ABP8IYA6_9BACT
MKRYYFALALLGLASHAFAQSEADALRFSRTQFGGSARTQAIGGATTALGADVGNLSGNPAGLGLFQRSEFTFTPGFGLANTKTSGLGTSVSDERNSLHVANLAVVLANRLPDDDHTSDWRSGALGIGFTRTNDFNTQFRYSGAVDDRASVYQRFREPRIDTTAIFRQYDRDQYYDLDALAYGALITNVRANGEVYIPTALQRAGVITQSGVVTSSGAQTQFDIAYGASYRDKLYLGGALGIVTTRYNETRELTETDADPTTSFNSLTQRDEDQFRGSALNLRIGAIYRLSDWVRLGATVHTPTFGSQTISYTTSLRTTFSPALRLTNNQTTAGENVAIEPGEFSYRLNTPWRASGGVAVVAGKYGFFSGDVEYVDYSSARLQDDPNDDFNDNFDIENQAIEENYRPAVNVRLGAEGRFDVFRVRAGYARYGDPFANSDFDRTQQFFTGGVGLRQKNLFLDLAGVYTKSDRFYQPYTLASDLQPRVQVQNNRFTTTVTLGVQF